jgi:hypothetical protein
LRLRPTAVLVTRLRVPQGMAHLRIPDDFYRLLIRPEDNGGNRLVLFRQRKRLIWPQE